MAAEQAGGMTWALILTLSLSQHLYSGASSMTTVTGFASKAACMNAADAWLREAGRTFNEPRMSALCVPQS